MTPDVVRRRHNEFSRVYEQAAKRQPDSDGDGRGMRQHQEPATKLQI
jgi:hypothetical protein